MASEYHAFFGDDAALRSEVTLHEDGRVSLRDLTLSTASLNLGGELDLNAQRQPQRFSLQGQISNPDGGLVRLPIPGDPVTLDRMLLDVGYDVDLANTFKANFELFNLEASAAGATRLAIQAVGSLPQEGNRIDAVTADLLLESEGVRHN